MKRLLNRRLWLGVIGVMSVHVAQAAAQDLVGSAAETMRSSKPVINPQKAYPGGRDEDDLVVQEEIKSPPLTVDRRTIEMRVLKTYFKKTDAEIVAPTKAEEEHPPSESE